PSSGATSAHNSPTWTYYLASLPLVGIAIIGAGVATRRRRLLGVLLSCLAMSGLAVLAACGNGSGGGGGGGGGGSTASLVYSTYWGTGGDEKGTAVAVDLAGNAYVTGEAAGLPSTSGFAGGAHDAFVTEFGPTGTLVFSTFVGGTSDDVGLGIAVDQNCNANCTVYITGNTQSVDFPATGGFQTFLAGAQDAFVTKLDPTGV